MPSPRPALALLLLATAACHRQDASDPAPTTQIAAAKPPAAFGICKSCHSVEPGVTVFGPSLHGVYGTRAGTAPGYAFSDALKSSGLVLDDATLDKWLANPIALVPGTRMGYAGQPDPARRKAIIAYLKTLK